MILNPLAAFYCGVKGGHIAEDEDRIKERLIRIFHDDKVYKQTQDEVFGREFSQFCKDVWDKHLSPKHPVQTQVSEPESVHA
jgi:hypothetical protein